MSEIVDCITFIIRKTFWSLGVFLQFLALRLLDLLGLVFNLLACATLYRLPYTVMLLLDLDDLWEWRYVGFVQLMIFFSDLPVLLAALFVTMTIWRVYPMYKELKEKECEWDFQKKNSFYYSGCLPRGIIVKHFLLIFIDIVFVPAGLLCLISWRSLIFIRKMREAETDWDRRKQCFVELFQVFVDIPCILFLILSIPTWRLPFLVRDIKRMRQKKTWNTIRFLGFKHFFLLFIDLPCLICLVLCSVTWRCPFIWRRLRRHNIYKEQKEMRLLALEEALLLLWDIPCILCALFVVATIFRLPFLIQKIKGALRRSKGIQWKIRSASLTQAGIVFVDLCCCFLSLLLLVTVWRWYPLVRDIRKRVGQWKLGQSAGKGDTSEDKNVNGEQKEERVHEDTGMIPETKASVDTKPGCPVVELQPPSEENSSPQNDAGDVTTDDQPSSTMNESDLCEEHNETALTDLSTAGGVSPKHGSKDPDLPRTEDETKNDEPESAISSEHTQSAIAQSGDDNRGQSERTETVVGSQSNNEGTPRLQVETEVKQRSQSELDESGEGGKLGYASVPSDEKEGEDEGVRGRRLSTKVNARTSFPGWKIRKDIAKHFALLLIDIPALVLFVLLLVTGLKVPRLISTLLQSGNFYLEFAATVYYLTLQLFVDLFFLILFFLLLLLRPFTTWVHVFEDEEHKKFRLLRFYRQWIPDLLDERKKLFEHMDELLSVDLKVYKEEESFLQDINELFDPHMKKLGWVLKKLKDNELDPDFIHVMELFMFWELKRPLKIARRYRCEHAYMLRPDPLLRKENLFRCHREMLTYESSVREAEKSLRDYEAMKVPLWAHKNGFMTRSRKETRKILLHCLPRGTIFIVSMGLICCLPIYRAPSLIKRLWKRWFDRVHIVLDTLKEYGLDFLAFGSILLVLLFLYRAPFLILDLTVDIFQKHSWKAARETAFSYPPLILEDIVDLIITLFSWKTPRFLVTALLFGVLMPVDLFLNVAKLLLKMKLLAYLTSAIFYVIFIGFPFVHVFHLGSKFVHDHEGWINVPVLGSFIVAFLVFLLLMVISSIRKNHSVYHLRPDTCDYIHFNWFNLHIILFELLEFLQLMALVFSIRGIPMFGGSTLADVSRYALLSFVSFNAKFWITFALFWIWFFLGGAPIIFEQILDDLPKNSCSRHPGWRLALSLFANTLFVTFFESFATTVGCLYPSCPQGPNVTCLSTLVEDPTYHCWSGSHPLYALFGLLALVWYGSTALIFGTQYGDTDVSKLDVRFSPLYNVLVNLTKGVIVMVAVVITGSPYVLLSILLACFLFLVIFTIAFEPFFNYPVCNLRSFAVWRAGSFAACVVAVLAVFIGFGLADQGSKVPILILSGGLLIIFIASLVFSLRLRSSSNVIGARKEFCQAISALEEKLLKNGNMLSSWNRRRRRWIRMLNSVREARKNDATYDKASWLQVLPVPQESAAEAEESSHLSPPLQPASGSNSSVAEDGAAHSDLPPPPSYGKTADEAAVEPPPPHVHHVIELHQVRTGANDVDTPPFDAPLILMKHTGVNMIMVFEQSIQYLTFNYAFLAQRETWLAAVAGSNWTGLLHCLKVLESCLGSGYITPTRLDLALAQKALESDVLGSDPQDDVAPPQYTPEPRDMETIARMSASLREAAVRDIASLETYGELWSQLMDKILPTLPVIRLWKFENVGGAVTFSMRLRRPVTGTITAVGPNGVQLARGASIVLGKEVDGMLSAYRLSFTGKQPKGKKGPVQVMVREITLSRKKHLWYLESAGKSIKFDKAIATIGEVQWK